MSFCVALLTDVANELRDRGALNEEECFHRATFVMAKGGGLEIGARKRGKRHETGGLWDRHVIARSRVSPPPRAANQSRSAFCTANVFDFYMIRSQAENLIGDRAL